MISDNDRQHLYDAISNLLMDTRTKVSKLAKTSLAKPATLETIEQILAKVQDDAAQLAVSTAATLQSVKNHDVEVSRLKKALERYTSCRHGCEECNCTTEARAVLYPYVVKETAAGGK